MLAHHSLDAGQRRSGGRAIGDFIETKETNKVNYRRRFHRFDSVSIRFRLQKTNCDVYWATLCIA